MQGSDRSKYCSQCGHHVQNLSFLNERERLGLLARAKTERVCGSYLMRLSGELVTPEAPLGGRERVTIKQYGAAILSAAAMALVSGCVTGAHSGAAISEKQISSNDPTKSGQPSVADKKTDKTDEDITMFVGIIAPFECTPPQHVPGHVGK